MYGMSAQRPQTVVLGLDKYPFLADPIDLVSRVYGISSIKLIVEARKEVLSKAFERIMLALKKGSLTGFSTGSLELEVLTFYISLAVGLMLESKWVISRLSLAESERCAEYLNSEPLEAIEALAHRIGLELRLEDPPLRDPIALVGSSTVLYLEYPFSISFIEYVKAARRLLGDPQWKPVNLPVSRGRVYLDKRRAIRLVKEVVVEYIMSHCTKRATKILEELSSSKEFANIVDKVKEELNKLQKTWIKPKEAAMQLSQPTIIKEEFFPPCMRELMERARQGDNLSHHERFALATFLLNLGAEIDDVVQVFRNMPDFDEKRTRYQVEHLAGLRGSMKKYKVYGCEKMRTLGLCRGECKTRSPVQAYLKTLRLALKEAHKAKKS